MDVEKLIECVRAHVCLYDLGHKLYKNILFKNEIWLSIGRELNESGEAVKQKWKTIRDGYTKYKKQIKGTTGSSRRNIGYTWASQLAFLDHCNLPRETHSNVPAETPSTSPSILQSQPRGHTPEFSDDINLQSLCPSPPSQISRPPMQATPSSLQAIPSSSQAIPSSSQAIPSSSQAIPSSSQAIPSSSQATRSVSSNSSRNAKRAKGHAESDDDVEKVIQFLSSNKNKKELDLTDSLFLSYADTFKKFPSREQAIVKLEMAKLFSNIELSLLDSNSYNPLDTRTSMGSPACSNESSVNNNTIQDSPASQPINLSAEKNTNVEEEISLPDEFFYD